MRIPAFGRPEKYLPAKIARLLEGIPDVRPPEFLFFDRTEGGRL